MQPDYGGSFKEVACLFLINIKVLSHNFIFNKEPALYPCICNDHLEWFIENLEVITVNLFHKDYTIEDCGCKWVVSS